MKSSPARFVSRDAISFAALLLAALPVRAGNWPQFRGPQSCGVADDARPPGEFGPDMAVAWKTAVPPGISSPIIWSDRIFLTGIEGDKPRMLCLSRADGKILWQKSVPVEKLESVHQASSPATATPVTDGERVIAWFPTFGLMAWDFDGKEVWRKPMEMPFVVNGSGTSPVLAGGKLILCCDQQAGKSWLLAADAATGATIWRTPRPLAVSNYTTPVIWRRDGAEEIVVAGSLRLTAYGLADGREHWTAGGLEAVSVCPTPVIGGGNLYAMSRSFGGQAPPAGMETMMLFADKDKNGRLSREEVPFLKKDGAFDFIDSNRDDAITADEIKASSDYLRHAEFGLFALREPGAATGDLTATHVAWKHQKGIAKVSSPLFYRDRLWVVADGGLLTCTDAKSGRIVFERERLGGDAGGDYFASPVAADGRIFLCSTRGTVTVVEAADTLKIVLQTKLDAPIQATPALAGERLFIRTALQLWAFGK